MTATAAGVYCYAVRRVNPFEGVLQVVETRAARAYSPNGRVWQVQVLAQRPEHTWRSGNSTSVVEQFFGFGLWDADEGLHRIPANPVMDIGAMQASADALVAVLEEESLRVPFPLVDEYEYWSIDFEGLPVALLATSDTADRIDGIRVARWMATRDADNGFVSASLLESDGGTGSNSDPQRHAERLEHRVAQAEQSRAWYRRTADGSGRLLRPDGRDETLPPSAFPDVGLKTAWTDRPTAALVRDYLEWSAPRLLMLQRLSSQVRSWLEEAACRQAVELAKSRRLYPEVIDRRRVEAACVEARLRSAR